MTKPQRQTDQIAEERGKDHLPKPGHQRHHAQRPDQLYVQLDADQKQQHRNAKFRQQVDLRIRPHDIQRRRPCNQPDRDEADDQGLARQRADQPDSGGHDQKQGHFGKRGQYRHQGFPSESRPFDPSLGCLGAV